MECLPRCRARQANWWSFWSAVMGTLVTQSVKCRQDITGTSFEFADRPIITQRSMSHTFVSLCIAGYARQRGVREEHHTTLPGVLWIGAGMDGMSRRVP